MAIVIKKVTAKKGIFFVMYIHVEQNKARSMDVLGGPYHSAKELQEGYDHILRNNSTLNRRLIQGIQLVSV
jgi:hypothetical protein